MLVSKEIDQSFDTEVYNYLSDINLPYNWGETFSKKHYPNIVKQYKDYGIEIKKDIVNNYKQKYADYIEKVIKPFKDCGYVVKLNDDSTKTYCYKRQGFLASVCFKVTLTEDEQTNPFRMLINVLMVEPEYVSICKSTEPLGFIFEISNALRLKHTRSAKYHSDYYVNSRYFTHRGFLKYSYAIYRNTNPIENWYKIALEMAKFFKSSTKEILNTNVQKKLELKQNEKLYNIYEGDVLNLLEMLNEQLPKPFHFILYTTVEKVDCGNELKFTLYGTNDIKCNNTNDFKNTKWKNQIPVELYSYEYSGVTTLSNYSYMYEIVLTYYFDTNNWSYNICVPSGHNTLIKIFKIKNCDSDLNIDDITNRIIMYFKNDNILYNHMKQLEVEYDPATIQNA